MADNAQAYPPGQVFRVILPLGQAHSPCPHAGNIAPNGFSILAPKGLSYDRGTDRVLAGFRSSIRRDLTRLETRGLIRRTHGGATLVQELLYEPFATIRRSRPANIVWSRRKRHIGVAAAELVAEKRRLA